MHPYIHCGIIYSSQDMEATEVPTDGWMGKENMHTHTHTSIFLDSHQHICEIQIAQLLLTIGHGMEARSNAVKSNIV